MPAISFQSVSKTFPAARGATGQGLKALDDVSFNIEEGEFFGLLGPNGAGKTTLISILAGLSRATSGRVLVQGHDVQVDYALARRRLGVVPQELVFDPFFNVREALRFQSGYFGVKHNDDWIDELLDSLGLTDKANANMRQLSGGMKRRVLVAQALVHKPPVIVLDEPTAGVDVELRQTLWQFIARLNKQGHTVLLTTHYLEEAEALCGRIAMLKQGRVVALSKMVDLLKSASSNVLRFKIDSELPPFLVGKARITGRIVQLPAHNAREVEQYLAAIREAGLQAEDIEIRKADLEDVFLDVMGGKALSGDGPALDSNPGRALDGETPALFGLSESAQADSEPQASAPSGGSAVREATSVGAIP
jgi:ABC-2 type transport system ATP-binding protein